MEVVLKVVALFKLIALEKLLCVGRVGRVAPSCGGTKVNDNRKMSGGNSSK